MADAATTPKPTLTKTDDGYLVASWAGALNGVATGGQVCMSRIKPGSMSLQVGGTFGSATAVLQGSNDGTNFVTCRMAAAIAIAGTPDAASFTAAGAGKVLDDAFRFYRMSTSGGTNSAVTMLLVAMRD